MSLDLKFAKAFNELSKFDENLAPDIMLKLYAYYKQAVLGNTFCYGGEVDVRDAFKFNAWRQLNGMTQEDAKKQYIKLVNKILNNQIN
jgi:diazepam-binding inhibitor (GABA receptor modulating acyl-CoA-binding protein)